jgi:hypothetical protein
MTEVSLYAPQNEKDLREQYPELWEVEEFSSLEIKELLLTWYYGAPTSPYSQLPHIQAVEESFLAVYKSHDKIPADKISKWLENDLSETQKIAVNRWKSMNVSMRIKSKTMVDKMLSNLEKMADVTDQDFQKYDEEGNVVKGVDWAARTQYANFCRITSQLLPDLIKQSEQGFGITKVKGQVPKGTKAIDRYHKNQKSN